jgi:glycosyltransferase involved in cell wall biosynthesis
MDSAAIPARLPITAVILTRDEELHIVRAIASLGFVERVVVVDSGSRDRTVELARAAGAEVFHRDWVNYADQFQWAIDCTGIVSPWTLRLDADEVIEDDLARRIAAELPGLAAEVTGIAFKRKHIFMGRWVRFGGRYPLVLLRLWRTGKGRIEARWMDEHIVVDEGRTIVLDGGFADINLNDSRFFTDKHNGYATREALDALIARYGLAAGDHSSAMAAGSAQARLKRWIKLRLYNRLPFGLGPLAYFLWRFIFQLGFLDGREGRIYHVLQGFWYRYLVDLRKLEFERALAGATTREERLARLAEASGYPIAALAGSASRIERDPIAAQGLPE